MALQRTRVAGALTTELQARSPLGVLYTIAKYTGNTRADGQWRVSRDTEEETLYWATTLREAKATAEKTVKEAEPIVKPMIEAMVKELSKTTEAMAQVAKAVAAPKKIQITHDAAGRVNGGTARPMNEVK